jgi:hypothetical protein
MSDNLIYAINPLIISTITWHKGKRWGIHPVMSKYLNKKNPIRGFFGFYENGLFDGYWLPEVRIYGSDGDRIKIIACRSNDEAKQLKNDLMEKLDAFLSNLKDIK